jgi:hypothetical protein
VGQVDQVREVAVLAEELAEGDPLAGRRRVELVRRPGDDDDVAAPARVERIGAVDVLQVLLVEDRRQDLGARMGRVGQVLERGLDLGDDARFRHARRERRVDVDLGRAAGPAGLREVDRRRRSRWTGRRHGGATVARLLRGLESGIGQDLRRVDRVPLRGEAVI